MKCVILAGGRGTRLGEETDTKPKPMVQIGKYPILWHIMKTYAQAGVDEFVVCLGYKGYVIKEYFSNYFLHSSDVTFDLRTNGMKVHNQGAEPWRVSLIDTGEETLTGGRLKRVREFVSDGTFCFTYGDGVADVDIQELLRFHKDHGKLATLTAVQPPGRFGALDLDGGRIERFKEKPDGGGWINGGFMVLEPEAVDYVEGDMTSWEAGPLEELASEGELMAYQHDGFWLPMDTPRDVRRLERLWEDGQAPWKVWG